MNDATAKEAIVRSIEAYPGRSVYAARTFASCFEGVDKQQFDKLIPELLREGRITATVDEQDYVRYNAL